MPLTSSAPAAPYSVSAHAGGTPALSFSVSARIVQALIVACCLAAGLVFGSALARAQSDNESSVPAPSAATGAGSGFSLSPDSPFSGSAPEEKPTPGVLPLSFKDAVERGLRSNLGLLLQGDNTMYVHGERWKELSNLLPNFNASVSENVQQTDLAALGFRGFIPGIPSVIGPFNYFDAHFALKQQVFDLHALERERGAALNVKAAQQSYNDARDFVVLAVGNAYLLTIAAASRVDTAQAQVETAQALYGKSSDQLKAGLIPAIDSLRAQVELQSRQQQLIAVRNAYEKQKLTLGRVIGLAPGQEFTLTTKAPYEPLAAMGIDEALRRAYSSRSDYQSALTKIQAAQFFRKAATAEHIPSVDVAANYGAVGVNPGSSHGTFQVAGTLNIPIFSGGKAHADALQAEANLRQYNSQLDDLRGKIDYEVRSALLDLQSAAQQVEVARSTLDLASQTLDQARDRFAAGVVDNLEVVQAQESVAAANESYISSLYAHNLAKVELAHAIGYAEKGVLEFLNRQ